ncbi:MAG TPA: RDD family protein [Bacteroidia bacterium]|nr:RDD family protein [Bacteroidia bacterium]
MITISDSARRIILARGVAYFIDCIIISIALVVIAFLVQLSDVAASLIGLLSPAYFIFFHATSGQTIGKKLFYIKLVDFNTKQKVSVFQAFKRQLIWILYNVVSVVLVTRWFAEYEINTTNLGAVITLSLLISVLVDNNHRGIHDKIGGTVVISSHTGTDNTV